MDFAGEYLKPAVGNKSALSLNAAQYAHNISSL